MGWVFWRSKSKRKGRSHFVQASLTLRLLPCLESCSGFLQPTILRTESQACLAGSSPNGSLVTENHDLLMSAIVHTESAQGLPSVRETEVFNSPLPSIFAGAMTSQHWWVACSRALVSDINR